MSCSKTTQTVDFRTDQRFQKVMSDSVSGPISAITRVESDLRNGSPGVEIGMPDAPADDAHTKHEINRMTWLFIGKLISARLLDLPNLQDPASYGQFDYAFRVIASCIAEEFYT